MENMTGDKLKLLRLKENMTQQQMLERINAALNNCGRDSISLGTYRNWEQNVAIPNSAYLKVLSKLFEVTTDWLLGVEKSTESPAISRTVVSMKNMNQIGQEIVAVHAETLDKSGQYKRTDTPTE